MRTSSRLFRRSGLAVIVLSTISFVQAQNPRQVPPVNQKGSQFAPRSNEQQSKSGSLNAKDRDFMKKAAEGGMKEVEMGRMAEEQGKSADVKAFGRRMVTDHSKANSE